jgi:hypothetical protein
VCSSKEEAEYLAADPWYRFPGMAHINLNGERPTKWDGVAFIESRQVTNWQQQEKVAEFPDAPDVEPQPRFANEWRFKARENV